MSVRKTTTDVASSSVGTKAQGAGVNQEKGQNQMTRENTVNVPREPTEAMLKAVYPLNGNRVWKAMLSAAPLHEGEGEDWSELERLATEATPGPWQNGFDDLEGVVSLGATDDGNVVCQPPASYMELSQARWDNNAAFIAAANPATILKLIASARSAPPPSVEVDRLREANEVLLGHLRLMQKAATAYLIPEDYRDRDGKVTLNGDHNNTDQWKQGQRGFRAEAFANDMIYLLDGPEQRAAEAKARAALSRKQEPGVPTPGGEGK